MPSPEREGDQVAKQADGSFDWDLWQVEYDRRLAERQQQLLGDALCVLPRDGRLGHRQGPG